MSVLLGTDNPELSELLTGNVQEKHALAVTTRAQKKNQERLEEDKHQQERTCEVQSHALNELDTSTSQEDTSDWVEMEEMVWTQQYEDQENKSGKS